MSAFGRAPRSASSRTTSGTGSRPQSGSLTLIQGLQMGVNGSALRNEISMFSSPSLGSLDLNMSMSNLSTSSTNVLSNSTARMNTNIISGTRNGNATGDGHRDVDRHGDGVGDGDGDRGGEGGGGE